MGPTPRVMTSFLNPVLIYCRVMILNMTNQSLIILLKKTSNKHSRRGVLNTQYLFVCGWWFSPGTPVSSTNKTEILLKVALNTINPSNKHYNVGDYRLYMHF